MEATDRHVFAHRPIRSPDLRLPLPSRYLTASQMRPVQIEGTRVVSAPPIGGSVETAFAPIPWAPCSLPRLQSRRQSIRQSPQNGPITSSSPILRPSLPIDHHFNLVVADPLWAGRDCRLSSAGFRQFGEKNVLAFRIVAHAAFAPR